MTTYDERLAAAESALRPRLTPEFLSALVQAVETCGWAVDANETVCFVKYLFSLAEQPMPTLVLVVPD